MYMYDISLYQYSMSMSGKFLIVIDQVFNGEPVYKGTVTELSKVRAYRNSLSPSFVDTTYRIDLSRQESITKLEAQKILDHFRVNIGGNIDADADKEQLFSLFFKKPHAVERLEAYFTTWITPNDAAGHDIAFYPNTTDPVVLGVSSMMQKFYVEYLLVSSKTLPQFRKCSRRPANVAILCQPMYVRAEGTDYLILYETKPQPVKEPRQYGPKPKPLRMDEMPDLPESKQNAINYRGETQDPDEDIEIKEEKF